MGNYSDMDIDMKYETGNPFEDSQPFASDEDGVDSMQETAPTVSQSTAAEDAVSASEDEDSKRRAHEESEAKRKAEWEAKQQAKKAAEQEQLDKLAATSDDEIMMAAAKRIGADTERMTRRNMKECISEHIQTLCLDDPAFARKTMHPRKSMIHCIRYINRQAKEYAEQEMKDNGYKPEGGIYGCDVPDDLCYKWAEDYFNDPNAKEDEEKEEKFISKPYSNGKAGSKSKAKKETAKKPVAAPKPADGEQMSLLGVTG